jgi:succinyl-CoA synthetase beta subunit
VKIHEYQAKQLLSRYGISIPQGNVAVTPEQAGECAEQLGGQVTLKAQIKTARTPAKAEAMARAMLGSRLVTHQTGPEGLPVNSVLVEEAVPVQKEFYLAMLLDTSAYAPVMIASEAGGAEIEEVAASSPEKITKQSINLVTGLLSYQARALAYRLNMAPQIIAAATGIMQGMYRLFMEKDCSLVEINPLALSADGRLLALDAKVNFDDNALSRHPDITQLRDTSQEDPLEIEAAEAGVNYVKLDGNVGCLVNGAGLAMATMDLITWAGGEPANFLDVGGAATEESITRALDILLSDSKVKAAWVNVFAGILRCDMVARAVIRTLKGREVQVPFIVRMQGTNLEEGMNLLKESGLSILFEPDLVAAARKAVALAK